MTASQAGATRAHDTDVGDTAVDDPAVGDTAAQDPDADAGRATPVERAAARDAAPDGRDRTGGAPAGEEASVQAQSQPPTERDWCHDAVFYGIDVAKFFDTDRDGRGDLPGVTAKMDYLHDLGVSCLWLLPFFPSTRRDNGYDITDYLGVDERFGTLDDFRDVTRAAHERGIKVMLDLVVHHTSAKHPWFQAAISDQGSRFADYYIWSKAKPADTEYDNVFPEEETGIWTYSAHVDSYYRHKFYSFQPDLNIASDAVWDEIKGIIDFWVSLGVDAFRVDAAPHLFADVGVPGKNANRDERLDDLRAYLADRAPHVALVGETDLPGPQIEPFLHARRFDLLYNFLGNNALFLGIVRESARPLAEQFRALGELRGDGWLNFVRNLDELDLEQLTDSERSEVFDALAPDDDMRIYGRGIRRAWAPMMRNDDQLRMTMSLLFALPGTPLLMFGQELGMGDDLSIPGRSTVRLPMQWSSEPFGGFTLNGDTEVAERAHADGRFGYKRVNADDQRGDASSLWQLTRSLATLRTAHPQVRNRGPQLFDAENAALLVLEDEQVTTVHNLSRHPQKLPDVDTSHPLLGSGVSKGRLPGYGFVWLETRS